MAKKKTNNVQTAAVTPQPRQQEYRSIGDVAETAYLRFGDYANNHRQLPDVRDGFKISYRRIITCALKHPVGAHMKVASLLGEVASLHPHSCDSLAGTIGNFVHSGIFGGDGNFGEVFVLDGDVVDPASGRYISCWISQKYRNILGDLIKDVPWQESPVDGKEPDYLPTPIPLCFDMKYHMSGLGVAIRTEIPSFSMQSLYQAYIHNDPSLLEPGIDLILDKSRSDLQGLWTTGQGKVTYSYHLSRAVGDDGKSESIIFQGDTGVFQVKLSRKLKKLQEEGKIVVDNISDINGPKMSITRVPGARGVTIDDIAKLAEEVCSNTTMYSLNVTDGKSAFRIPLYQWLDATYKNYISLLRYSVSKKIAQTEFDIAVQTALPAVASAIMTNPKITDKEIMQSLGLAQEVVSAIMSKPISQLRKTKDNSARLKALKEKLKELKSFDPVKYTEQIISEF